MHKRFVIQINVLIYKGRTHYFTNLKCLSDSLGVAGGVQHHFSSTTGRIAVVEELIEHAIVHLWGQVPHKQREVLTAAHTEKTDCILSETK